MTHKYQSLVREIATPTLPNFVSSCLSLISSRLPSRGLDVPFSLVEMVFESFSTLILHYPTVFRPSTHQIRTVVRPFLAPTLCDRRFVPPFLSQSARRLSVLLYQTSAKNTGGEEWGKGVRDLVRDIHSTTDQIYRSVIEDWESVTGYISQPVDFNLEVQGGAKTKEDLPAWIGIYAGVERIVGLLNLLGEHFNCQTSTAVTIPLGIVNDLLIRLMSVVPPTIVKGRSEHGVMRLHPAIERNEREGLWAGLERVHTASVQVYLSIVDRLQETFTSMARGCLDQVMWTFLTGKHDETFRTVTYELVGKLLPLCGARLEKPAVDRMGSVIRACCKEFIAPVDSDPLRTQIEGVGKSSTNGPSADPDYFPQGKKSQGQNQNPSQKISNAEVISAARRLLPLLLSHLPQQHLEAYLRAEIDRTLIIHHHKEGMLASVLNPFMGKNGRGLSSILPHLCRQFPNDNVVEALLRPRMPVIRQNQGQLHIPESLKDKDSDEEEDVMEDIIVAEMQPIMVGNGSLYTGTTTVDVATDIPRRDDVERPPNTKSALPTSVCTVEMIRGDSTGSVAKGPTTAGPRASLLPPVGVGLRAETVPANVGDGEGGEDSDDESVHLTMDLSESDDESVA